jgi:hypothetical protein
LEWSVRAGRARPWAARLGLVLWILVSGLWFRFGPPGMLLVLLALGVYLVGPLWVPARYRVDDQGVMRRTPFGERLHPWGTLGDWGVSRDERTAWLGLKGRGTARFLPPILLLWEAGEGPEFRARLESALAARLGFGAGRRP